MNALRLCLLALASLLAIAACGALIGSINAAREAGGVTAAFWLSLVLIIFFLALPCGVLFWLAGQFDAVARTRALAASETEPETVLACPMCDSERLVQGPERPRIVWGATYEARCPDCGYRVEVAKDDWKQLPVPEHGDPFETWADKRHRMRQAPMTGGQLAFVVLGILVSVPLFFLLPDTAEAFELAGIAFLGVVTASWWLGRALFPPEQTDRRPRA